MKTPRSQPEQVVAVIQRQHSGLTPMCWELVAVCANDESLAKQIIETDMARSPDQWRDEDDYYVSTQRVLTSVPESMRGGS